MKSIPIIITQANSNITKISTVTTIDFDKEMVNLGSGYVKSVIINSNEKDPELILKMFCEKWCDKDKDSNEMYSHLLITLMKVKIKR